MASGINFGYSKLVFSKLYLVKSASSQNPLHDSDLSWDVQNDVPKPHYNIFQILAPVPSACDFSSISAAVSVGITSHKTNKPLVSWQTSKTWIIEFMYFNDQEIWTQNRLRTSCQWCHPSWQACWCSRRSHPSYDRIDQIQRKNGLCMGT